MLSVKREYLVHLTWVFFRPGSTMVGSIADPLRTGEPMFAFTGEDESCQNAQRYVSAVNQRALKQLTVK